MVGMGLLGKAPKPVKLSVRTSAWRVMDIRALIQKLDNESEKTAPE